MSESIDGSSSSFPSRISNDNAAKSDKVEIPNKSNLSDSSISSWNGEVKSSKVLESGNPQIPKGETPRDFKQKTLNTFNVSKALEEKINGYRTKLSGADLEEELKFLEDQIKIEKFIEELGELLEMFGGKKKKGEKKGGKGVKKKPGKDSHVSGASVTLSAIFGLTEIVKRMLQVQERMSAQEENEGESKKLSNNRLDIEEAVSEGKAEEFIAFLANEVLDKIREGNTLVDVEKIELEMNQEVEAHKKQDFRGRLDSMQVFLNEAIGRVEQSDDPKVRSFLQELLAISAALQDFKEQISEDMLLDVEINRKFREAAASIIGHYSDMIFSGKDTAGVAAIMIRNIRGTTETQEKEVNEALNKLQILAKQLIKLLTRLVELMQSGQLSQQNMALVNDLFNGLKDNFQNVSLSIVSEKLENSDVDLSLLGELMDFEKNDGMEGFNHHHLQG